MFPLSDRQICALWERGADQHPTRRAITLLAAARPEDAHDELCDLPLGRRELMLARARTAQFGPTVRGTVECPSCCHTVELTVDLRDVLPETAPAPAAVGEWRHGELAVRFRLPSSADLAAIASAADAGIAAAKLLARCVLGIDGPAGPADVADLPDPIRHRLGEHLAACDPHAETLLELSCPECGGRWQVMLDVAAVLWREIDALARRVLAQVHRLASAYGWSERDILAMSPRRRDHYLELLG